MQSHIEAGRSFAVETTLRTNAAIEQAQLGRARGFATEMIFVATDSIDENVARILQHAQGGGHGASEREVRAIHEASLANLGAAIEAFERVDVYDSTALWSTPRLAGALRSIELEARVSQALTHALKACSRLITEEQARQYGIGRLVADALRNGTQDELHRERVVDGALGWATRHVLTFDLVVKSRQAPKRWRAE